MSTGEREQRRPAPGAAADDDDDRDGPAEYASPACYLHELQDDYGLHADERGRAVPAPEGRAPEADERERED